MKNTKKMPRRSLSLLSQVRAWRILEQQAIAPSFPDSLCTFRVPYAIFVCFLFHASAYVARTFSGETFLFCQAEARGLSRQSYLTSLKVKTLDTFDHFFFIQKNLSKGKGPVLLEENAHIPSLPSG
jgi:hypothetical protein